MGLVLTKEDGSGKADANAYADATDGDAFHEGHLYATAWTAATSGNKAAALVMATRLIDAEYQFNGLRVKDTQALQWPRRQCRIPDFEDELPENAVPKDVLAATCETARALLIEDRTANPLGEGLKFSGLGGMQQSFDKADRRPVIPYVAQAMLAKYGALVRRKSGAVPLVRT
jgi:hypothetical protein